MAELLDDLPATSAYLDAATLGLRAPLRIPIRLWASKHDDLVPFSTVQDLARAWNVPLQARNFPRVLGRTGLSHFGPYFTHLAKDAKWLVRHLAG